MSETIRNANGVLIKKCCASCDHMKIHRRGPYAARICDDGEGAVSPSQICEGWKLKKGLEKAGIGGGRIKKLEYLYTIREKTPEGDRLKPSQIKEIAAEYESAHGSIYEQI